MRAKAKIDLQNLAYNIRVRDDADPDVALRAEALGENAQRDGLAGAGGAGDEGEAAFADELLDAPAERLDAARHVQRTQTRGLAPAKKPRAPKPANDLDQANARIVELEEELKSARSIAPVTDIAEHAAEPTDPVVTTVTCRRRLVTLERIAAP